VIRKGDIRWFLFALPDKRRPVVVLGRDAVLPSLAQVPVVPVSTQIRNLPRELVLTEDDGVPESCVVKVEWIRIRRDDVPATLDRAATFGPARQWRRSAVGGTPHDACCRSLRGPGRA
jgi:mRNA-degrading endonuclease toxin of MazEF toxin-antitoxin module